ncbi:heterokaryon incompatibility protein-domain-containing protein [Lenzites betulinus]|nr:heterokaryon incompatibility protein-domain-containing protein [Lenzites betulinus]
MDVDAAVPRTPSASSLSFEEHNEGPDTADDPFGSRTATVSPTLLVDPWQTLTQLPFFPYDCRLAGYTLPPKPDTLCASCWEGPFGAHAAWLFDVPDGCQHSSPPESALKSYSYRISQGGLKSNADMDCVWCEEVKAPFQAAKWEPVNVDIEMGLFFDDGAPPSGMHMIRVTAYAGSKTERYAYKLNDDHPAARHIKTHAPILNVGSTRAFQSARELMQNCEQNHERCREIVIPAEETTLPKRLINCTDPERPRLVESPEGECGQYVALSYVWGGDQPFKTTLSNVRKYERGLELALLPQTIQQAIRVTRELGFELLWVDSLCIVQDSENEKQHEIGRMHYIYRYAALTIVAASANGAREGFLQDRHPWQPSSSFYTLSVPVLSPQAHATAAPRMGTLTLYNDFELPSHKETYEQPINQRAWCFQEQLMSPRSLIFSHNVLFRCQTATHSIGTSFYNWAGELRLPDALLLHTPSPPKHDTSDWHYIHGIWQQLVLEYTLRSMSDPSDKLVACGAIAEAFHRVLDSDYLAGLWRHSLFTDLSWFVPMTSTPRRRPAAFRAPSWSWAAVDSDVVFPEHQSLYEYDIAEVIRCDVTLKEASLPFGQVSGGSLVLRAQLLRLRLTNIHACDLQFNPTEQAFRNRPSNHAEDAAAESGQLWFDVEWGPLYDSYDYSGDELLWAIPLARHNVYNDPSYDQLDGLIVAQVDPAANEPSVEGSKTLYRRIGWFECLECPGKADTQRLLIQPLRNKEAPLQEIEII